MRKGVLLKKYVSCPISYGQLESVGRLNEEARERCEHAMRCMPQGETVLLLAGGNGSSAYKTGLHCNGCAASRYLEEECGLPLEQMVNWGHYAETTLVDEIVTLRRALLFIRDKSETDAPKPEKCEIIPRVVTSWWNAPLVWVVCWIVFGKAVRVHVSVTTLSVPRISLEVFLEAVRFLPSCLRALRARRRGFPMWWEGLIVGGIEYPHSENV